MNIKLGVVMDPISSITVYKDSTFAMLLEAQRRGWGLYYMEQKDLYLQNGSPMAVARPLLVTDSRTAWFELGHPASIHLDQLHVILMRKDPPFNMEYIYTTYLLSRAEDEGVLVVNRPQSLRDANEKVFTAWFPQCTPPTLVTRQAALIRDFHAQHGEMILKPLDGMGGASVFRISPADPNLNVVIETLSESGQRTIMAQRYIPEIREGDKRILIVDGKPIPYALARIPAEGETRGNLAAGGSGKGIELSQQDRWICEQVGPGLVEKGLLFVGLDVIGDYLTEINVTSPTCIRELDQLYSLNIAGQLMDAIEQKLTCR